MPNLVTCWLYLIDRTRSGDDFDFGTAISNNLAILYDSTRSFTRGDNLISFGVDDVHRCWVLTRRLSVMFDIRCCGAVATSASAM